MSSIDSSTGGDGSPEVNVIDYRNPRTPERRPFRPLTPIGANASPTLSEGFIRDYLSPGTAYIPGLRCSSSPITRGNSPARGPGGAEVWSSSKDGIPATPARPHHPPRWPSPAEGETSPDLRLRWINDFVPHTLYKPSSQGQRPYATRTLQVVEQVLQTEAPPPNNVPLGPPTHDRHSRSRCITPGKGDISPLLRDCSPMNNAVRVSSAGSLYCSGDLVPGAAHSKQDQQSTADRIISTALSEASRTPKVPATEWLVDTEGDDVSPTPPADSMDMNVRDDDRHGEVSPRLSQKSAPHVEGLLSKVPRFTKEYLSNLFDDIDGCVWQTQDDVSMSNASEDDDSRPAGGCWTSRGYSNFSGRPEASELDPIVVEASPGSRDNPINMDIDIPGPGIPLGRQGYWMTDEEFFRYETPGPGYQTVHSLSLLSASSIAPISNKRTATMHHHCESEDSAELSPSITHSHRKTRSGPMEIESRTQGHTSGTNECSDGEGTATNAGRIIKKEVTTPPVVDKRVQALIDEGAHGAALWTPTPHWIKHIPGTDISMVRSVIQRGSSSASGTGASPIRARHSRSTARRSRAITRPGDRTVGTGDLSRPALDSVGPSSAISTRRRMVTSPNKSVVPFEEFLGFHEADSVFPMRRRRQVSERGHSSHLNPVAWNNDDLLEEPCKEESPEDELDCNLKNLHDPKH
ncbi:hypothetical protein DFP73DRAFT_529869 [Morchella snyderi]|nr:hypothetical protein DFP73DRAFT_529869 [Morchella snyderi]